MFRICIKPHTLVFKQPAGTSRGVYTEHPVWYVIFRDTEDPAHVGIGECAPLYDLSCDYHPGYADTLADFCRLTEERQEVDTELLRDFPSILFGLETGWRHYQQRSWQLWDTPFSRGNEGIPINGLIWMADYAHMQKQIEEKLRQGFRCIKLKIGAIDFEQEFQLLRAIRDQFTPEQITLRVDANGHFSKEEAPEILARLAELAIHSIEQPIRAGQWADMATLCATTPLPIALDEELIGIHDPVEKRVLLQTIRPQYIILKPSLHGGISGSTEWIKLADEFKIGWWITSALESNIGLNGIAQWCATFRNPLPQGLGTGMLYTNNIDMPLVIRNDRLWLEKTIPFPEIAVDYSLTETITIEGHTYAKSEFIQDEKPAFANQSPFHQQLYRFLRDWFSESTTIGVQTSGSTGAPKQIRVPKAKMWQSAKMTCDFFGLKSLDKLLLCLPLDYIAGKMIVVRALYAGLDLYPKAPDGHPLAKDEQAYAFAAMVPLQVYNALQNQEETNRLSRIRQVIIGGGAIDLAMEKQLVGFPNAIYSTYGMTETLSHIALRRLSGDEASAYYTPLAAVKLSLSPQETLVIEAPRLADEILTTNDRAELRADGRFRILGRIDNVINSGGIKIQIEEIEQLLSPFLKESFAITGIAHPKLGEAIILLTEKNDPDGIRQICEKVLSRYQQPVRICTVTHIPQTGNGKIDRRATKKMAEQICPPISSEK